MLLLVMSVLLVSGLNMESAHAEAGLKVPFMNEFLPLFDESPCCPICFTMLKSESECRILIFEMTYIASAC